MSAKAAFDKRLFNRRRAVCRVGPNGAARVSLVEQFVEHLRVVDRRVGDGERAYKFILDVNADVVLVAEVRAVVFLRPAGVGVLLTSLIVAPILGHVTLFIDVRESSELLGNPFPSRMSGSRSLALVSLLMRRSIIWSFSFLGLRCFGQDTMLASTIVPFFAAYPLL